MNGNPPDGSKHSRAFETFVDGSDDLSGLIAYALYKQSMRERAMNGHELLRPDQRIPTETEKHSYREAADRRLQDFASRATEAAAPEIVRAGLGTAIEEAQNTIVSTINGKTSIWLSIIVNVIGWLISLAITFLVVLNQPAFLEMFRSPPPTASSGAGASGTR